jgi:hypothetical protein
MNTLKDIPWYEWLYSITEDGRVWGYPRKWSSTNGLFLKPKKSRWYFAVVLTKNLEERTFYNHRLNAISRIPNPNNYPVVRHLDNNKLNNHISNLQWSTYSVNSQQMHDDWLHNCGKKIMQLTKEWILCKVYKSAMDAVRETGVNQWNMCSCARWKKELAGGFIWKYLI